MDTGDRAWRTGTFKEMILSGAKFQGNENPPILPHRRKIVTSSTSSLSTESLPAKSRRAKGDRHLEDAELVPFLAQTLK
jgi:hypothetical protein